MPLITRQGKGSRLTIEEMDGNLELLYTQSLTPSDGYSYAEVFISSSQILAMGTTPVELLPTLDLNEYYEIDKILFEYTHVTTGYTSDLYTILTGQIGTASEFAIITNTLLNNIGGFNHILEVRKNNTYTESSETGGSAVLWDPMVMRNEQAVYLTTYSGGNPTGGDSTLRAIIKYKIREFGITI